MTPNTFKGSRTLCVALATLGLATPVLAQQDRTVDRDRDRQTQPGDLTDRAGRAGDHDFRSFKWITGLDVFNNSGDHIADVSDLIVNRGSGKIDHVVLATGQTLGLGGKTITIPFDSLRWDSAKDRFVLNSTEAELKNYPEFTADSWAGLNDPDRNKKNSLRDWLTRDRDQYDTDPYATGLGNAKQETIQGTISSVDRVQTATGELMVASVKDDSGKTYRVWLGPSWYVAGSSHTPMRGDKVTINAYSLNNNGNDSYVGRSMTLDGSELTFRNDQGAAVWGPSNRPAEIPDRSDRNAQPGNRDNGRYAYNVDRDATWRTLLASELTGRKVMCRGEECGKVNDLVVDRASGRVVMISIDPNQNFLGIADTKRLVPWSIAAVAVDGTLRIDASKEMVLASPETPSDIEKLNNGTVANSVYQAYEVGTPRYDVNDDNWHMKRDHNDRDEDRRDRK